uniref:DUF4440 domain-containing protein n=1 Tax=Haemonchus placei TaxID=6290 RepID=A0A0N4X5G1_HAEPC
LLHRGKGCTYGREGEFFEKQFPVFQFFEIMKLFHERTYHGMTNEKYQMTTDYIILEADYELTTEKKGTVKGKFTQIWKKTSSGYMIWHDEFDIN